MLRQQRGSFLHKKRLNIRFKSKPLAMSHRGLSMYFEKNIVSKKVLPSSFGTDYYGKALRRSAAALHAIERDADGNTHAVTMVNGVITVMNLSTDTWYETEELSATQQLLNAAIVGFLPDGKPLTRLSVLSNSNNAENSQSEDKLLHGAKELAPSCSKNIICALDHDHLAWTAIEKHEDKYFNVIRNMKQVIGVDPVTFERSHLNRALVHLPNGGIVTATTTYFNDEHSEHTLRIVGESATASCGEMQTLDLIHQDDQVMAVFTEGTCICIMPIPLKDLETGIRNGTLFNGEKTSPEDAIRVIPNVHFSWYRGHLTRLTETRFAFVITTAKGTGVHVSWQIWSPNGLTDGPAFDVVSRIFTVDGEARYYGIRGHELYEMRLH